MTLVAKDIAARFYGRPVTYAYWNGCSTGGRQGYSEAQNYPNDYDGVLAAAPAVNWDRFAVATLWPQVVFNEEHVAPTLCELDAFNAAAVKACDSLDGVKDGIIDNPQDCTWNPRKLVGTKVVCDGQTLTITAEVADAVRKIWAGPVAPNGKKLWYGPNIGADFTYLADVNQPFFVADSWAKYFVAKNPALDTKKLTYASFAQLFAASQKQFNRVIGTDDPDLSGFRAAGGKLLSWQGQSDQLVPTRHGRLPQAGGADDGRGSAGRRFLPALPAARRRALQGGPGPQATDPLAPGHVVEKGHAPATLATAVLDADAR